MNHKRQVWILVGTRPNFIKVTRFKKEAEKFDDIEITIIHSGQHYDEAMASVFFDQFGLRPDHFLEIQPAHPAVQIANTTLRLTELFARNKPDLFIVVGDVNTTLAGAIAANKSTIPLAHLESGLRSFDRSMPEEHNRKVADELADLHFITEDSGLRNLKEEGKPDAGFAMVGNTMIDTLVAYDGQIQNSKVVETLGLEPSKYALVTMHRPSNVDTRDGLEMMIEVLRALAKRIDVVFSTHPRTRNRISELGFEEDIDRISGLHVIPPQGYFDFQKLVRDSKLVLTDSGGIQEETTFLRKPCLTLRPNTERPVTIEQGTNTLLQFHLAHIEPLIDDILADRYKKGEIPKLWDGNATNRVLERVNLFFEQGY